MPDEVMNASNANFSQCCHGKAEFHLRQIKEAIDLLQCRPAELLRKGCMVRTAIC
jgi:hypothetical protein